MHTMKRNVRKSNFLSRITSEIHSVTIRKELQGSNKHFPQITLLFGFGIHSFDTFAAEFLLNYVSLN